MITCKPGRGKKVAVEVQVSEGTREGDFSSAKIKEVLLELVFFFWRLMLEYFSLKGSGIITGLPFTLEGKENHDKISCFFNNDFRNSNYLGISCSTFVLHHLTSIFLFTYFMW